MEPFTCRLCHYEWTPRKLAPVQCPRCKRYDWMPVEPVEAPR